jgi:hypothetical protein
MMDRRLRLPDNVPKKSEQQSEKAKYDADNKMTGAADENGPVSGMNSQNVMTRDGVSNV